MDTCSLCYNPVDMCECDSDAVYFDSRKRDQAAETDTKQYEAKLRQAHHNRIAQDILEVMQYQYVQVSDDHNSKRS